MGVAEGGLREYATGACSRQHHSHFLKSGGSHEFKVKERSCKRFAQTPARALIRAKEIYNCLRDSVEHIPFTAARTFYDRGMKVILFIYGMEICSDLHIWFKTKARNECGLWQTWRGKSRMFILPFPRSYIPPPSPPWYRRRRHW